MAKSIMFQGTGSTVGKSIITAGLCRILADEGFKVAPFKSQNMALNSYVTADGKEMGRAQVVQAEAARVAPRVEMNPVLLKPTSDMGSQVILEGKVFKNLSASVYYDHKAFLMEKVLKNYQVLCDEYDVVVIEGAGSPAEINLRQNDIVNMGLAEAVDTPVILIGDIDKCGVFAAIYGTYMLLSESEQKRIKGYIINKFRGDVSLLVPGIEMFREKLDIPCLGVVPYKPLAIDDEDSVSERIMKKMGEVKEGVLQIGVIKLPYMSNFTDFTVLENEPSLDLSYVSTPEEIAGLDVCILPGSKSTIADLDYIKKKDLDKAVINHLAMGKILLGICGGYQMLGHRIVDPRGHESVVSEAYGLDLFPMETLMASDKTTTLVAGEYHIETDLVDVSVTPKTPLINKGRVSGYEIHMGVSEYYKSYNPLITLEDGRKDGAYAFFDKGLVIGTYLHGILDDVDFRQFIINHCRLAKGLKPLEAYDYKGFKDAAYNDLASLLRKSLDIEAIKKIAGIES